jgi:hypothetical protein
MDVLPWPNGYGFTGHEVWWRYVHSQSERERLDHLMGLALLDKTVSERLVTERDPGLFTAFHLSEHTQHWLMNTSAATLKELAQAIVGGGQAAGLASTEKYVPDPY